MWRLGVRNTELANEQDFPNCVELEKGLDITDGRAGAASVYAKFSRLATVKHATRTLDSTSDKHIRGEGSSKSLTHEPQ